MATPSIAMIPSAYKAGTLYSVLPTDGNGDLDVVRASSATRVNQDGLIELMANNVPRLDYSDGSCPSLLLEPQSTNLVTYSEDFSDASWAKNSMAVVSNDIISPKGDLTADKVTGDGYIQNLISLTATNVYTFSFFWKKDTSDVVKILLSSSGTDEELSINTNTLALISQVGIDSYDNIYFGDGWYRLSMTWSESNTESTGVRIIADESDATSSLYIWGAQLEQQSYATSYIPTSGATATRLADGASKTGISSLINSSEGVLYGDVNIIDGDDSTRRLSVSDGTNNNSVYLEITNTYKLYLVRSGGVSQFSLLENNTELNFKFALKYKLGDFAFWLNGVEVGQTTTGSLPLNLSRIGFDRGEGGVSFYGNCKDLRVYNLALTDDELATLTS